MIPEKFGRYEIKAELGRGGMAIVYLARDPRFDRDVAIKVLPREFLFDPQFHTRFEREIKTVAKLEHPAIVPVHDVGEENGQPYFVMRYIPGGSLSEWLKHGAISLQDTARIVERIARGLEYAHSKGVVHRDLKPGNILFDINNDAFISDFGVAKLADAAVSMTGSGVIGTPAYMSPEQAQSGQVDGRSDIYALGAIIYEMLTGQQPYKADTPMSVILKHITDPVPEITREHPEFSEEIDAVIKKAMHKDPEQRYSSTLELTRDFNKAVFGKEGHLTELSVTRPAAMPEPGTVLANSMAATVGPGELKSASSTSDSSDSPKKNKKWISLGFAGAAVLLLCAAGIVFAFRQNASLAVPTVTPLPTSTPYPTQAVELPGTVESITVTVPPPTVAPVDFGISEWRGSFLEPWGVRVGMTLSVLRINGAEFTGKMAWNFGECAALMALNGEVIADINAATEQNRWSQLPNYQSGDTSGLWLRWTQTENQGNPNCYVNTGDWWYAHVGSDGHMIAIRFMNNTDLKPANGTLDITPK